jgi:protein-S-isoprenylcysteine O-methyltransferase Ste14
MAGRSAAELVRLSLLYLVVVLLLWLSKPEPWTVLAGACFVIAGELIRIWAAGHLFKTRKLITSGPYRYTRNPLYLGRLLLFTGVGLMAHFPHGINVAVLLLGWTVFFGYYMPRKERIEPARLLGIHGESYRVYRDAVPALFPTVAPFPDNGERWQSDRFRRNREAMTAVGLAAVVLVFALRAFKIVP